MYIELFCSKFFEVLLTGSFTRMVHGRLKDKRIPAAGLALTLVGTKIKNHCI